MDDPSRSSANTFIGYSYLRPFNEQRRFDTNSTTRRTFLLLIASASRSGDAEVKILSKQTSSCLRHGFDEERAIQVHVPSLATRFRNEQTGVTGRATQRALVAGYGGIVIGTDWIIGAKPHLI